MRHSKVIRKKLRRLKENQDDIPAVIFVSDHKPKVCKLSPSQAAVAQVQEMFPFVDPNHVLSKLTYPITPQSVQTIIQDLLSDSNYPKIKPARKKEEKKQVDYANDEYERSPVYKHECYECLLQDFPFSCKSGLLKLLNYHQGKYFKTYMHILDMIKSSKNGCSDIDIYDEYLRLINGGKIHAREGEHFMFDVNGIKYTMLLKHPRRKNKEMNVHVTNEILLDEIKVTQNKMNEWRMAVENERRRLQARKRAEQSGNTVQCTCCYGDYAFEEMVSCQDGHLFCVDCLRRYAEERVFGNNDLGGKGSTELCCMDTSGCDSWFSRDQLEKSLSSKVMKKYDELQAAIVLEKAGLEGLCKCPKCDFQASLPESEIVFRCPICDYESCRKCGEESHIPLRCNEVEKKTETDARLQVEEAMTKARIRYCPKGCKQGFYKVRLVHVLYFEKFCL